MLDAHKIVYTSTICNLTIFYTFYYYNKTLIFHVRIKRMFRLIVALEDFFSLRNMEIPDRHNEIQLRLTFSSKDS